MKIAIAQTNIIWEDKDKNIDNAELYIKSRINTGVDIIFFPEMSFTGFSMNVNKTAETNNYTLNKIKNLVNKYGIGIGFGWVRKNQNNSLFENVYTIIDSKCNIISEYVKIHPFSQDGEDNYFCKGNKIIISKLNNIPFSSFICYDLRFPEIFRKIAKNVHVVIIAACWPEKRAEHWKKLLTARAIENQIYIVAINCQGNINGVCYSGDSCFITPTGNVTKALSNEAGIIEIDFKDDTQEYRNKFKVLDDIVDVNSLEVVNLYN